ncbi:hypothetical protein AeRB84_013074, partial [Aphanomyces euteiches]
YFKLEQFLEALDLTEDLLLRRSEKTELQSVFEDLERLESVNKALQHDDMDLSKTRILFDGIINDFGSQDGTGVERYLCARPSISDWPDFECGICMIIAGEIRLLSDAEKAAVACFVKEDVSSSNIEVVARRSYADGLLMEKRRRIEESSLNCYMDLKFIPPTSNLVERLFSRAKLVKSDRRMRMLPIHLEMLTFLSSKKRFWGLCQVEQAMEMNE